ncbi:flagellin [Methylobacterium sp. Leaf87]|uniref:flagellin N-terminal helical domain-containing protein n=1 Tax=Methylobacterium sp. Leaf87 TaxID=1736243 RepID=UPI0006F4CD08|nr:flagellin [Methylobacterium sp. Leaf87]KQO69479.1 flagellin [Methylobacterium sp. Leaf87]
MTSLLTNNAAMTALTTLKSINSQLDMTSNRVSTGQRVSNAADNAAYWSIATTVRTDNASLGAVKDSLGLGSSAVDTAYNGLNSIITDLQNMRAKLQTALQPGVDRSKVQTEITAIQNKMQATANSSNSSGQNWLSVDSANTAVYKPDQSIVAGFSRDTAGTVTFSKIIVDVKAIKLYDVNSTPTATAATVAQLTGDKALSGTSLFATGATAGTANFSVAANAVNLTIVSSSGTATLVLDATSMASAAKDVKNVTTSEFVDALNNQIAASSIGVAKVSASLDSVGRLVFTSSDTGSAAKIDVSNTSVATKEVGFGLTTAITTGKGTAAGSASSKGILDTVDGPTTFSVKSIDITNVTDSILEKIITQVDKALAKVTDAGTKLGANKTQIDGQKTFVDTLMKANDRTIGILVDADIEEESTKLKALQTQQQLAVQSLSIANSSSQGVLALFR